MAQTQMTRDQAVAIATRARSRDKRNRLRGEEMEATLVRKAGGVLAAGAFGVMTQYAVPNDIAGFPWKVPVWAAVTLVEVFSDNKYVTAFFGGLSDATAAVYVDRALSTKSVVAGLEHVGELESVGAGGELP